MKTRLACLFVAFIATLCSYNPAHAQRVMENLGRGIAALNQGDGRVYVAWRLLGTDVQGTTFNVYRATGGNDPVKLNDVPISDVTFFQDSGVDLTQDNVYTVRPVVNGTEGEPNGAYLGTVAANDPAHGYFEIPLQLPDETRPGDGSIADLDGDGEYEIIVKGIQRSRDTASAGITGNTVLQAYKVDGTLMWTIQMGINIREGEHDTQFMVYDLDSDGRAEVALRTSDGSVDGTGKVIGDPDADWRVLDPQSRAYGKNMEGPEYFTIFDGMTGAELVSVPYIPSQFPLDSWGGIGGNSGNDTRGNRNMRFLACVAYLDGEHPSVIMCRGVYGRTVLAAWDWRDGELTSRWVFDSLEHPHGGAPYITRSATVDTQVGLNKVTDNTGVWEGIEPGQAMVWDRNGVKEYRRILAVDGNVLTVDQPMTPGEGKPSHVYGYSGMGGHSLSVADVDDDGRDEIVYNAMVVDDDGEGLFTTGFRHGDALHVSDLDPSHPGLEVVGPHENEGSEWDEWTPGAAMYSARDGELLWGIRYGEDIGRGLASDIDPRHPGAEVWAIGRGLYSSQGEVISEQNPRMTNFVIWWDGDLLREMVDGNRIAKWDWEASEMVNLLTAEGARAANGTKNSPVVSGDLFGDWREECILTVGTSALRIYMSDIPTEHRMTTLMHNPQYRLAIAWQNVTYNQPPHPSFFLGAGMDAPPEADIRVVDRP